MSLTSRSFHDSNDTFHPLFRLLDDFDSYSRQNRGSGRSALPFFQPKFDVREMKDAFELHGELAGISKENVHIEFSDPHTLQIHGHVERSYTSGTPPAGLIHDKSSNTIAASGKQDSHKATVEDDDTTKANSAPAAEATSGEGQNDKSQAPPDTAKYWVSERSIGQFSRTFNFPGQIQQDAVSADLRDGILTVRIPKAPKNEHRHRIQIN